MKRKLSFMLLLLGVSCLLAFPQVSRTHNYEYDRAGNRISRSILTLRSSMQAVDSLSEEFKIEKEGLSKNLFDCKVTLYPNPTQGEVNISISGGDEEALSEITIFSNSGQLLITRQVKGNVTVPIDLSPYLNGFYLINFQQGESKSYYKVIKH